MAYLDLSLKPSALAFTQDFLDGSGVQYGVSYDEKTGKVSVQAGSFMAIFDVCQLDWFIKRLERVKAEIGSDE